MDDVTIVLGPDEISALRRLAIAAGPSATPEGIARDLLRDGLTTRLNLLGVAGPPSGQPPNDSSSQASVEPTRASAANRSPARRALRDNEIVRSAVLGGLVLAALVALGGGYLGGWSWTGFRDNNQLWDWLSLLLLPLAFATLPLWLRHPEYISRTRRISYAVVVIAFVAFVIIGYTMPLGWTGFSGNRLWDWLVLILLPVTLITVTTWASTSRTIHRRHIVAIAVLAIGWLLTVIGGYLWGWSWTGYQGNTLWDWLQLVLLPIVIPTVLAPAAVNFVRGGDATQPAQQAAVSSSPERTPDQLDPADV